MGVPQNRLLPVSLAVNKTVNPRFADNFHILNMIVIMEFLQKVHSFTGFKIIALPAAVDAFLAAAFPNLADRGAATAPTGPFTAEFYHGSQELVALGVVLEVSEVGNSSHLLGSGGELRLPHFFAKVSGQVSHFTFIYIAVTAVQATVSD